MSTATVVTGPKRSEVLRLCSRQPLHDFFGYNHSYNIHPIFDFLSLHDNLKVLLVFSILNAVGLTSQTGQTGAAQRSSCLSTGAKVGICWRCHCCNRGACGLDAP